MGEQTHYNTCIYIQFSKRLLVLNQRQLIWIGGSRTFYIRETEEVLKIPCYKTGPQMEHQHRFLSCAIELLDYLHYSRFRARIYPDKFHSMHAICLSFKRQNRANYLFSQEDQTYAILYCFFLPFIGWLVIVGRSRLTPSRPPFHRDRECSKKDNVMVAAAVVVSARGRNTASGGRGTPESHWLQAVLCGEPRARGHAT